MKDLIHGDRVELARHHNDDEVELLLLVLLRSIHAPAGAPPLDPRILPLSRRRSLPHHFLVDPSPLPPLADFTPNQEQQLRWTWRTPSTASASSSPAAITTRTAAGARVHGQEDSLVRSCSSPSLRHTTGGSPARAPASAPAHNEEEEEILLVLLACTAKMPSDREEPLPLPVVSTMASLALPQPKLVGHHCPSVSDSCALSKTRLWLEGKEQMF